MNNNEIYIAIAVMALANFITRVFPFLFFTKKEQPSYIKFISNNFPAMIMIILIFYTLAKIDFATAPYGIKELIAIAITALLHIKLNNYLVSIFVGTISYMALVQYVG
jgi:branched-subunit amino acid transport protein AzlD